MGDDGYVSINASVLDDRYPTGKTKHTIRGCLAIILFACILVLAMFALFAGVSTAHSMDDVKSTVINSVQKVRVPPVLSSGLVREGWVVFRYPPTHFTHFQCFPP